VGVKGTLLHCWWECKLVQPLWKAIWRLLKTKHRSTGAFKKSRRKREEKKKEAFGLQSRGISAHNAISSLISDFCTGLSSTHLGTHKHYVQFVEFVLSFACKVGEVLDD
jgi:hypothetical protein